MNAPIDRMSWPLLTSSVLVIFLLLHGSATALGSVRGEAGLAVGAIVLAACLFAQQLLRPQSLRSAAHTLGLGRPTAGSIGVALGISSLLLLTLPAFVMATGSHATLHAGWLVLLPGLLAQGGIAEEALFRGYLFGNLRQRNPFWRAALLSAGPFVAAHLLLFATMSWPVALAATLLALVSSFPLARLFELGAGTIWAPALVHFIMQAAVKIIEMPEATLRYPMMWLAACAVVPWLVFAVRMPEQRGHDA